MQPLKRQWAGLFASKGEAQPENAHCLAAMLDAADFKSECRSALFEAIDRELNSFSDPLKNRNARKGSNERRDY